MKVNRLESKTESPRKCCWVGGTRYSYPLDETSEKKFGALKKLGELFVIGFSTHFRARRFTQHARFFLLPQSRFPALRYLTFFVQSPIVLLWLVKRYGVNILVAQSPYEGFAAAWAKIVARIVFKKKVVVIVESHGDFERFLFLQSRTALSVVYRPIMKAVARFSLKRADALRAVSKATKKQLEVRSPGTPIVQFPAWTDMELFLQAGEQKRNFCSTPTILFVGSLVPGKGVHVALESFTSIADEFRVTELVIIGTSDDHTYVETLRKSIRPDLEERIRFLGQLPQSQVAQHMAEASVLVIPSLSEGLGRVIFEAMACQTPVIGSRVGGIPDMIQEGETGFLIPPGDASALARRLKWILKCPEKATEIGSSARKFAREFFSEEQYVENYSDLIEKSLS